MKCSICNTENSPDATSCQQCGFSSSLGQPAWPDFPTVEIPEPAAMPQWPEFSETEPSPVSPESVWPVDDVLVPSIESIKIESITDQIEVKEDFVAVESSLPDQPSDDDQLARSHIARGLEAIRKGLYDQAEWEFEQARDLADNVEIVRMAQAQLAELSVPAVQLAQEQAQFIKEPAQVLRAPAKPTGLSKPIDWDSAVRVGLIMGLLNGVLTGCGAVFLVGFLLTPLFGFATGWLIARYKTKTDYTVHENGGLSDVIQAVIAGGVAGIGGWLGQVIGCPIWIASLPETQTDSSALPFVACLAGAFYIPVAAALGALGWRVGRRKA